MKGDISSSADRRGGRSLSVCCRVMNLPTLPRHAALPCSTTPRCLRRHDAQLATYAAGARWRKTAVPSAWGKETRWRGLP